MAHLLLFLNKNQKSFWKFYISVTHSTKEELMVFLQEWGIEIEAVVI